MSSRRFRMWAGCARAVRTVRNNLTPTVTPTADPPCGDPGNAPATRSPGPAGSTCGGRARVTSKRVRAAFEAPVPVERRSRRAVLTCTRARCSLAADGTVSADGRRRGCPGRRPRERSFGCCRRRTPHSQGLRGSEPRRRRTPSCPLEDRGRLCAKNHAASIPPVITADLLWTMPCRTAPQSGASRAIAAPHAATAPRTCHHSGEGSCRYRTGAVAWAVHLRGTEDREGDRAAQPTSFPWTTVAE